MYLADVYAHWMKPAFEKIPPIPEVERYVVQLIGGRDGALFANGTGVMIGPQLMLTAWHNIGGIAEGLGVQNIYDRDDLSGMINLEGFNVYARQVMSLEPRHEVNMQVQHAFRSAFSKDLALLFMAHVSDSADQLTYSHLSINLFPVAPQDEVWGVGYSDSLIGTEMNEGIPLEHTLVFADGPVTAVYHERRDTGLLNFPCFQVDTIWPGGMSGGPIIYDGMLVGIITAGVNDQGKEPKVALWPKSSLPPVSYGTFLWPLMADIITLPQRLSEAVYGGHRRTEPKFMRTVC